MAGNSRIGSLDCIIDGVDECGKDSRTFLLRRISQLVSDHLDERNTSLPRLRFILISQPVADIRTCLTNATQISLDGPEAS